MKPLTLTLLMILCLAEVIFGQDKQDDDYYRRLEEKYQRMRDSISLLHPFVPAISSIMVRQGQVEINLFNALSTANEYRDLNGDKVEFPFRETYLNSTIQVTYGISSKSRVNIGIDLNTIQGRLDEDRTSSMFRLFCPSTGTSNRAGALTSIAPRLRWRPLKKSYNFTIQTSVGVPADISAAKRPILGQSQFYWLTQFIYNLPLNKRLFLITQYSPQYNFKRDNYQALFFSPLTTYLSWLIPHRVILFGLVNYLPFFEVQHNWAYRYTFQAGGGIQYQFSRSFLLNGYYTNDIFGKSYPAFSGYNISLRFATP